MAQEKTHNLTLTYAELELLLRATHSGMAETYCSVEDCDPDAAAGTDLALYGRAEAIRGKVIAMLDAIDAASAPSITAASLSLFLAYAKDAGNWSGQPLIGGNVGGSKEDCGNITQLKRAGLVKTYREGNDAFLAFTPAGVALASKHGVAVTES